MRILDTFCFAGELDLLEIRFNILDPYVDEFLICESTETFSGKEKPLYYKENKERFAKWKSKINHVEVKPMEADSAFERAAHQKDSIRHNLNFLDLDDEDVVYFGDVDEIWWPQEIDDNKVYNLRQLNYSYYLNNRSSEEWIGTVVGKWGTIKEHTFNYWRANHTNVLDNGGWHFSNQGGVAAIRQKLESYDHQEFNNPETRFLVEERMKNGEDYVGRKLDWQGKPFEFWTDESELPPYLIENKEKWKNLFR